MYGFVAFWMEHGQKCIHYLKKEVAVQCNLIFFSCQRRSCAFFFHFFKTVPAVLALQPSAFISCICRSRAFLQTLLLFHFLFSLSILNKVKRKAVKVVRGASVGRRALTTTSVSAPSTFQSPDYTVTYSNCKLKSISFNSIN